MSEEKKYKNKIQCNTCREIIESTYRHDFKFCKCRKVAVDGGQDYFKRVGYPSDYTEIIEEITDE